MPISGAPLLAGIAALSPQCNNPALRDTPDRYNSAFAMHWN
jgi:hypothetical protein